MLPCDASSRRSDFNRRNPIARDIDFIFPILYDTLYMGAYYVSAKGFLRLEQAALTIHRVSSSVVCSFAVALIAVFSLSQRT